MAVRSWREIAGGVLVGALGMGIVSSGAQTAESTVTIERDPFRPFTLEFRRRTEEPKTPLERYDIGSLQLVAILWEPENPRAMVEDDAGLGYTIEVGTRIGQNRGVVMEIEREKVIVEEETLDFYGEAHKTTTVLRLRPEEEG